MKTQFFVLALLLIGCSESQKRVSFKESTAAKSTLYPNRLSLYTTDGISRRETMHSMPQTSLFSRKAN